MSSEIIRNITDIAETQNNKYITHNNAIRDGMRAVFDILAKSVAGNITLTEAEASRSGIFTVAGATGAFNLVFPDTLNGQTFKGWMIVDNLNTTAAHICTVKSTSAGAVVAVPAATRAIIYRNGLNFYHITSQLVAGKTHDVGFFIPSKPASGATAMIFRAARAVTFPGNLLGSVGRTDINPTATAAFDVKKNGTSTGTISISTAGVFTFTTTSGNPVSLAIGDYLSIISPAPQDTTMADFSMTLLGYLT